MRIFSMIMALCLAAFISGCSSNKFHTYHGAEVTKVLIYKEQRKMYLMHHKKVLQEYDIGLGFSLEGHKQFKGDGRTPEGDYKIDRRNPNSIFYLSIGISYPNAQDIAYARKHGKNPGGDIFIHGRTWKDRKGGQDWTAGCIAVTNSEMREIYAMVKNGTPITIYP